MNTSQTREQILRNNQKSIHDLKDIIAKEHPGFKFVELNDDEYEDYVKNKLDPSNMDKGCGMSYASLYLGDRLHKDLKKKGLI
jgi:hypothetical protein